MSRIRTRVDTVYSFEELSEAAKEHAIEKLSDINVDYDWWDFDCLTGFNSAEIAKHHLKPEEWKYDLLKYKHLYFDLDRGQYIQFDQCEFANDETARKFLGVPKALWNQVYWSFENKGYGGNSHDNTRLEYEPQDNYKEFTEKQIAILNRAVERFADKVHDCWRMLRDDYEYRISKEAIIETIEANEYEFTENGNLA